MHVSIRRAGGFAALSAPVLMWSEFFVNALSRQGYNLLTRPFSDLATKGTPHATEFAIGFFLVPGLLTIVVGAGLWVAAHEGQAWRIGALLIIASGVFLFAAGVFQQDPRSFVEQVLHGTMAQICFAAASVGPLVLYIGSVRHSHLDPPRRIWLLAGLAALAIEGSAIALKPWLHFQDGFFQRPFTLALTVWFIATGIWLLRIHKTEGLSVTA